MDEVNIKLTRDEYDLLMNTFSFMEHVKGKTDDLYDLYNTLTRQSPGRNPSNDNKYYITNDYSLAFVPHSEKWLTRLV